MQTRLVFFCVLIFQNMSTRVIELMESVQFIVIFLMYFVFRIWMCVNLSHNFFLTLLYLRRNLNKLSMLKNKSPILLFLSNCNCLFHYHTIHISINIRAKFFFRQYFSSSKGWSCNLWSTYFDTSCQYWEVFSFMYQRFHLSTLDLRIWNSP